MVMTTLNLSSNLIRYVAIGGNGSLKYGSVSPEGLINNGLILQPDVIASQLKSLFNANSLPREKVICSINGLPFSYRLITMPKMEPEAFNEAVFRAIRKEIPISPEEMYLYWRAFPTDKNEWQVLVAGVTRQPVDSLIKTLREAGIPPYYLDLQPLALARLTSAKDAIIVECEKDYSNIVMLVDGIPQALNIIPSLGAQAAQPDEIRQVTGKLIKMVDFYNGNHPKQPVKDSVKVLLTGELANDAKIVELVRQEVANPVELLKAENKAIAKLPLHEYAVNAGSLLIDVTPKKENKETPPLRNIILGKIAADLKSGGAGGSGLKKTWLWGAIAVGIVALVLAFFFQSQTQSDIDQVKSDLTKANAQYKEIQNTINHSASIQDDIDKIKAQINSANANYAAVIGGNDYVGDIAAITRSQPENVAFTSFKLATGSISLFGKADKGSSVVQFARNLESIGGFSVASISWINGSNSGDDFSINFLINISR
jgi:Tfp pilus assembly PilM family ATPase/Tfp pilus assembly protein PilN